MYFFYFFFSSRRRHTRCGRDWSSDVCSSDLKREGGYTTYLPTGEEMNVYEASRKYIQDKTPLIVLTGKEYGSGSSRDWAAKGTILLGVKAVLAESYERIHRSNLIMMGVLPLEYLEGESAKTHGLTKEEAFSIKGIENDLSPLKKVMVSAKSQSGSEIHFKAIDRKSVV